VVGVGGWWLVLFAPFFLSFFPLFGLGGERADEVLGVGGVVRVRKWWWGVNYWGVPEGG